MTKAYLTTNNAYDAIYIPATGVVYEIAAAPGAPALVEFLTSPGDFTDWSYRDPFTLPDVDLETASQDEIEDAVEKNIGEIIAVRDDQEPAAEIRDHERLRERWAFHGCSGDCPI